MIPATTSIKSQDQNPRLIDLLKRLPGYVPELSPGAVTASGALLRIFARYLEIFDNGLEQVPGRSRIAFLEMLGIQLLPAQAARAPLVFGLLENASMDVILPRGSQVAAATQLSLPSLLKPDREATLAPEITFVTTQTVALCRGKIAALYSIDPGSDEFADHTQQLTEGFTLFDNMQRTEHAIYLGHDDLFALGGKNIIVMLSFSLQAGGANGLKTQWEYLTENGWSPLESAAQDDTTNGFRQDGSIMLHRDCGPQAKQETIQGRTSYWLRGRLTEPLRPQGYRGQLTVPVVNDIRARVGFTRSGLTPEAAFTDSVPLDISKEFYPFGQQPATYSTFYLACKEVFQRKGATIKMDIILDQPGAVPTGSILELSIQYFDGIVWQDLSTQPSNFDLTAPAITLSFNCPATWKETNVNGQTNYWLRIRITKGDYGQSFRGNVSIVASENINGISEDHTILKVMSQGYKGGEFIVLLRGTKKIVETVAAVKDSNNLVLTHAVFTKDNFSAGWKMKSPFGERSIAGISDDYKVLEVEGHGCSEGTPIVLAKGQTTINAKVSAVQDADHLALEQAVIIEDDFSSGWTMEAPALIPANLKPPVIRSIILDYTYLTDPFELDHCLSINDFVLEDHTEDCRWPMRIFKPFRPVADQQPALHFGFDQPLPTGLVSLYLDIPQKLEEDNRDSSAFVWEYRSANGWTELVVLDETSGFCHSGMVQFIGPPDAVRVTGLGGDLMRVRARLKQGEQLRSAPISGLWLNAVWAAQQTLPEREEPGVSDGNPRQTFSLRRKPILVGELIEIQEWRGRGDSWRTFLKDAPESDLRFERDPMTNEVTAVWVKWYAQPHLYDSTPGERHYLIERANGLIRFGDGQRGLIPPAGSRIFATYSSGGGLSGNLPAGVISELRTALPYIESVTNPVPASGGADIETGVAAKQRGSQRLRHHDRAVTAEDCEWLAREASPEVARVRCLSITGAAGHAQRGWFTLVIAPFSPDARPQPSPEFQRRIRDYLVQRVPAAVSRRVRIEGPQYAAVSVRAEIIPFEPGEAAQVEARLRENLSRFLHPLTGGFAGKGWSFGEPVYLSQIARVIEETSGVDYAREVRLSVNDQIFADTVPIDPFTLVAAGDHELKLSLRIEIES